MGTDGKINDLGRQYIGAVLPNTTDDYIPGVVSGGKGGQPGANNTSDSPKRSSIATSTPPSVFCSLAVALFSVLLI